MSKKQALDDNKILERLSELKTLLDEVSACVYVMSKKIMYLDGQVKRLAENKPWLFKDKRRLNTQQIIRLDSENKEKGNIKDLDENVSVNDFREDSTVIS